MKAHVDSIENVLSHFSSDQTVGLTTAQVEEKRAQFGENKLKEKKKKSIFARFFEQFKDVMIIILLIAAAISLGVAIYDGITHNKFDIVEMIEPFLILAIVLINAIMGVVQENKAEKALDALKNMSAPHARVIRDGVEKIVMSSELVPGDIIKLEAGDFVPADARLIKSVNLKSEESALTGESVPSEKFADAEVKEKAPIGDRTNMVFSGCSITYGTALAIVTATGMDTEMGKIAGILANENETKTPLQEKLAKLGSMLGILVLGICFVMFLVQIVRDGLGFDNIIGSFMSAISLAVSAIPEGLPAVVTIVLSIGVQRMVKRNAIIRRLPAVETLGSASIICSDKTGTLTMNRMTLVKAYVEGQEDLEDISSSNSDIVKKLLTYGTLCSDGSVIVKDGKETHIGDPTETSIVFAAYKNGLEKDALNEKYPRRAEIPFDSDRKLMTTVNEIDGKKVVIVKGAVDVMEKRCVKGDFEKAREMNEKMTSNALRVLAVGYKFIDEVPSDPTPELLENGLTFMGLVGMIDPPRPEAKAAVAVCKKAGIKAVMITGDHVSTASAIARELGILNEGDLAITGAELDEMSDEELDKKVEQISVYARVSPENKIRIVKAWQKKGQVVSMTGDGVNDAPALKAADIGCAMGITGTDVAKGAADMTLTDDNFATIVEAVKEGRGIFENIRKVVGFLLSTNLAEVLVVFISTVILGYIAGLGNPFIPIQLLWINLVTDSLPAVALGMEAVESDIMYQKPKSKNESLFSHGLGVKIGLNGLLLTITTLAGYIFGAYMMKDPSGALNHTAGSTMAFMVLAMSQLVQALNMRSSHSLFKVGFFSNKTMNISLLVCTALTAFVLFVPGVVSVFGMMTLEWWMYLIGLGLSLLPILVMEIAKAIGFIKVHNHK